jgi:hypothetical protein
MSTIETINIFLKERSYICALIASAIAYIILLSNTGSMGRYKNKDINSYYVGNITVSVFLSIALAFLVIHHSIQYFKISVEPVE